MDTGEFTIVIDSREKLPFTFHGYDTVVDNLTTGDYSIKGLEHLVAIERKSLDDLSGCITKSRERFCKELMRLKGYHCRAVIIESNMAEVFSGNYVSRVSPNSVIGSIASWQVKYGIPFVFAGNYGPQYTESIMRNYWQHCKAFAKNFDVSLKTSCVSKALAK